MSSANSEQLIEFDLNYKNLDVQQGETANLIIKHTITAKVNQDELFIKINGIEYDVEINEILKSNGNENLVADLESTYSHFVSFFSSKHSIERTVLITFPRNKFTKFVNSKLINGKFLFKITCGIDYETYFFHNGYYYLKNGNKRSPSSFIHSSEYKYRVNPSDEQISSVIEKNNYTRKLTTELQLMEEPINNQNLAGAVENLKIAAQGFIEGSFNSIILNTRNVISNNLTEWDNPNSSDRRRILRHEIKDSCLSHVPTRDKDDYNQILNYVGNIAASLSGIVNKYTHENQNTIRMRPLHADLELLYYSTSLVTKYLTTLNNTKS